MGGVDETEELGGSIGEVIICEDVRESFLSNREGDERYIGSG